MDIVQAVRAQMLGQLIDAISGAAKGAAVSTGAAQLPADSLKPGQTLTAAVLGQVADGRLAIRLQGQAIVADIGGADLPPEARQPGASLQLRVETGGQPPRLSLAGFTPPQAGASTAPPAATAQPESQTPAAIRLVATPASPAARPQAPTAPALTPIQAALRDAVASAAARQGSPAPLYANLAAALASPGPGLPEPVRQIAAALLSQRLDASQPITADAVKQAVAAAGVPAEALTVRDAPMLDARTLLQALKTALATDAPPLKPAPRTEAPVEPPRRDGGPQAQKPAAATLLAETEPKTAAGIIAREAEQALERIKLHHYAGLPEPRAASPEAQRPQQMSFELPLAFGHETAMAGFRIERDRRRKREGGEAIDVWGIRFAIETDEIGAVHAHLRLSGAALSVSLWADDAATHRAFADAAPLLEAALRDNAFDIGEIAVFSGRPHEPRRADAGRFLDVAS